MESILKALDNFIWSGPLLFLIIFVGIFLTFHLRGVQFRYLIYSLKLAFTRHDDQAEGDISHFQSLMTALAATIGIGSITGVATAVVIGGLGALFWMWVAALLGMATKYAEAILAVKFRTVDSEGQMCGGPMYYLEKGLKSKWLAVFFAIAGICASFGIGNVVQANSIAAASSHLFHIPAWSVGLFLSLVTISALFGGIKRIGKIAGFLVPVMAAFYICGGLVVIFLNLENLPSAFMQIFTSAFSGQAAVGGFLGSTFMLALQQGVSKGVFSSESGLGSAPIAAAAAKTDVPARQALVSMSGVFITSFIVCTITGLVIALTNTLGVFGVDGQLLNGSLLVYEAFESVFTGGGLFVTISLILFGYSTILGWAYYGEKCVEYLFTLKGVFLYRIIFCSILIPGAILSLDVVWSFSNIMNGMMGFPNLIGLIALCKIVSKETKDFDLLHRKELKK